MNNKDTVFRSLLTLLTSVDEDTFKKADKLISTLDSKVDQYEFWFLYHELFQKELKILSRKNGIETDYWFADGEYRQKTNKKLLKNIKDAKKL